jgi:hypothetical protein
MKKELTLLALAGLVLASCGGEKDDPVVTPDTPKAPSAPVNLKLHSATETTLKFQWDPVENAAAYDWELQKDGVKVDGGTAKTRNVEVTKLTKATDYRFGVKAVNAGGSSSMTWVDARTEGTVDPEPPTPPSDQYYADFSIPSVEEDGVARAFPGAEGGGMYTTGGRGGKVLHVTTLEDTGSEGSLRWAVNQSGARTVVFDVAGIIELKSDLKISKGDLTIAGQTAPGDGICLKNYSTYIGADNVIIRFVRFRLGDEAPWTDEQIKDGKADSQDALWGRYQNNIVLDHCSMSWSIDETASFYANAQMTMQWCIIAESMKSCRLHSKGDHGYGGIWGGKNASFHHNLLAHHQNRTPRFDHQYLYEGNDVSTDTYRGNVDYRNCVNYNWGPGNGCYGGEGGHFNLVNNYYRKGPDSNDKKYFIEADGGYSTEVKENGVKVTKYFPYDWPYLYLSGNYNHEYPSGHTSYPDGIYWKKAYSDYDRSYEGHAVSAAYSIKGLDGKDAYTTTHNASAAMEKVCEFAGASLVRDAVDARVCKDVKDGTGTIIKDIADVKAKYGSAWPAYTATREQMALVKDSDQDGMPDWFEEQFGLGKSDKNDAAQVTLDKNGRYTNLEMYLHYLVKDIVAAQNAGGNYMKL